MNPRASLILDSTVRLVFDAALVLSLYLLLSGHNQPGGGFVGGLVTGAAVALRFIAGGVAAIRTLFPVPPWGFLSAGLGLAATTALVPALFGAPLDHEIVEWAAPVLGHVVLTTALVFDTGVYLVVVGLVLMAFEGLADDEHDIAAPADGEDPRR
jgi:multicomponent Na+:H+ antiporter subunit A